MRQVRKLDEGPIPTPCAAGHPWPMVFTGFQRIAADTPAAAPLTLDVRQRPWRAQPGDLTRAQERETRSAVPSPHMEVCQP